MTSGIIIDDVAADLMVEAILTQAIHDYEFALRYKDGEPKNKNQEARKNTAIRLYNECISFFHSKLYTMMCKMNGDEMLERIKQHYIDYNCSILADEKTKRKKKRKVPLDLV